MAQTQKLIEMVEKYGAHNYHPLPVVLAKGRGAKVWDIEGKEYLDFLACYSALNFGHQHPQLVEAAKSQLDKLANCSRAFHNEELCYVSKELAEFCGMGSVLLMNSGTEAIETALKLARKWGYERKGAKPNGGKIVAMANNFHGRSISVVSFSTEPLYRDGYGPFTPGFVVVPFGDLSAVERAIDQDTIAILTEPIQAEAGILIPPRGYLSSLKEICQKKQMLLMFDEIQTGLGRTGRDFCFEYEGARPDVVILGKSLGGGLLPVSAVVSSKEVMSVFKPGQHGSTFGGNPLASAVARRAIRLLKEDKLSERSAALGEMAVSRLSAARLPKVREIRGRGLLIGIEMEVSAGGARRYAEAIASRGVLCKETHDHVIRIAPPLTISEPELMSGLDVIIKVINELS